MFANVPTRHLARFAEHEPPIVAHLVGLDVEQTRRAMQHWKRKADAFDDGGASKERDDEVRLSPALHGSGDRSIAGEPTGRYVETDEPISSPGLATLLCDAALHRLLWDQAPGVRDHGRAPASRGNRPDARSGGS